MIEKFEPAIDYLCSLHPSCDTYYDPLETKALKVALPIVGALAVIGVMGVGYKLLHGKRRVQTTNYPSYPLNPFGHQSFEPNHYASPYMGDPVIHVLRHTQDLIRVRQNDLDPTVRQNDLDPTVRQNDLDPTSSFKKMRFPPSNHAIVYLTMLWKMLHTALQAEVSSGCSFDKLARVADDFMQVSFILGSFALDDQNAFAGFLNHTLKPKTPISASDLLSDKYKEYYPRNLSLVVPEAYRYLKSKFRLQKDQFYEGTSMYGKWNSLYHAYLARRKQVAPDCDDPKLERDVQGRPFSLTEVIDLGKLVDPHKIFHSVAN